MNAIQIGHLLQASTTGFTVGCSVSQLEAPSFGALVRAPLEKDYQVYGLIYDIHIDEDGLVRQLVTAGNISEEIMRDNRERRIVPVEMAALTVGYQQGDRIYHLLPPRPPLSLDAVYLCTSEELTRFVAAGRLGYFRHLLRASDLPTGELLAAHIREVKNKARLEHWAEMAISELIAILRDDYSMLTSVLGALREIV